MASTKNKVVRYSILLAILVYLIGLVVYFPARVAVAFAPLPDDIKLQGVSGTVWRGHIEQLQFEQKTLEQVHWKLYPLALLGGMVATDVTISNAAANPMSGFARVQAGMFGGLQIETGRLTGQLNDVAQWLEIPNLVPLRGQLIVEIPDYELGQPLCTRLNATADVFDVETRIGTQWYALKNFKLELACQQGLVHVKTDPNNVLGLNVQGNLGDGHVDIAVSMKPTAEAPAPLHDLLRLVGKPDSSGRYDFKFHL